MAATRTHNAPPKVLGEMTPCLRALSPKGAPNPFVSQIRAAQVNEHSKRMSGRPSGEPRVPSKQRFVNGKTTRVA